MKESAVIEFADCAMQVVLRGDGTAWLPEVSTLLVADLHLGKDSSFRSAGIPVPTGVSTSILRDLQSAIHNTSAERLVILGDLVHDHNSLTKDLRAEISEWMESNRAVSISLVIGNHDASSGPQIRALGFKTFDHLQIGSCTLMHDVGGLKERENLSKVEPTLSIGGHIHPVTYIKDRWDKVRLSCFVSEPRTLVLPAFGPFKGGFHVEAAKDKSRRLHPIFEGKLLPVVI